MKIFLLFYSKNLLICHNLIEILNSVKYLELTIHHRYQHNTEESGSKEEIRAVEMRWRFSIISEIGFNSEVCDSLLAT